jgi:triphosphatase
MPQDPHIPQEVEAKLLASGSATLSAIARLKRVAAYRLRPRQTAHLYTVYLDTATFVLARHGIALRLRRNGTRWEASLKWSGKEDGIIHARPELTVRLSRAPTFPFSLPAAWQNTELPHLLAEMPVEPIVVSDVHRQRFAVYAEGHPQACAELALDRVRLRSPQRGSRPVVTYYEVEIEQEASGTVQDLLHFASLLQERFALTPAQGSKFSRGLSLLYGFAPTQEQNAAQPRTPAQRPAVRKRASPPTTQQ